jgi:hypothetical protein
MKREKTKAAVERAARIDWRGATDRQDLRSAFRYLRDELELHIAQRWGMLARLERFHFSVRTATDDLIDMLFELEAVDLIGIACLIRDRDDSKVRARRRKNARHTPAPLVPPSEPQSD